MELVEIFAQLELAASEACVNVPKDKSRAETNVQTCKLMNYTAGLVSGHVQRETVSMANANAILEKHGV